LSSRAKRPRSAFSASKFRPRARDGVGESENVFAALDAPAGRIVDDADERRKETLGAPGYDENQRDQGRRQGRKKRRFAGKGDLAPLGRVMQSFSVGSSV
jgi:hypothetical protein